MTSWEKTDYNRINTLFSELLQTLGKRAEKGGETPELSALQAVYNRYEEFLNEYVN
jgi:hypothetical protein